MYKFWNMPLKGMDKYCPCLFPLLDHWGADMMVGAGAATVDPEAQSIY